MNTNDSIICSLFMQWEEIIATFYGYELQLSKIYTRHVYNRFKEKYKSSTTFSICEDTSWNVYYFVEHKVVQIEFPWLQHEFYGRSSPYFNRIKWKKRSPCHPLLGRNLSRHRVRLSGSPPHRCQRQSMAQPMQLPRRAVAGLSPVHSYSPRVAVASGSFGRNGWSRHGVRCWADGEADHRVAGSGVWSGGSAGSGGWWQRGRLGRHGAASHRVASALMVRYGRWSPPLPSPPCSALVVSLVL
jgi:hypothetical protein